jgi:site-specific DNA-adenine methylase
MTGRHVFAKMWVFSLFFAKYKINNNNETNTKHEFNVKYERYKQDISKDTLQMQKKVKKSTFLCFLLILC